MRYLVQARVGPGREKDLINAIDDRSLGRGSIAGDEYLRDMKHARLDSDETCPPQKNKIPRFWPKLEGICGTIRGLIFRLAFQLDHGGTLSCGKAP
jgi:hypothetical protein